MSHDQATYRKLSLWVSAGLIGLLGLISLTACSTNVTVMEVWSNDDGAALEFILSSCNADVNLQVEEGAHQVVVRAEYQNPRPFWSGSDDCQDLVRVELEQPLGDRAVVNSAGDALAVRER